jgi:hypothetical protein
MSKDLQTDLPGTLQTLSTYGHNFLEPDELGALLRRHVSSYYQFLGKSWLLGREKHFWTYHRKQLSNSQIGYSHIRTLTGVLAVILQSVLTPGEALKKALKAKRQRHELPSASQPTGDNKIDVQLQKQELSL